MFTKFGRFYCTVLFFSCNIACLKLQNIKRYERRSPKRERDIDRERDKQTDRRKFGGLFATCRHALLPNMSTLVIL